MLKIIKRTLYNSNGAQKVTWRRWKNSLGLVELVLNRLGSIQQWTKQPWNVPTSRAYPYNKHIPHESRRIMSWQKLYLKFQLQSLVHKFFFFSIFVSPFLWVFLFFGKLEWKIQLEIGIKLSIVTSSPNLQIGIAHIRGAHPKCSMPSIRRLANLPRPPKLPLKLDMINLKWRSIKLT